MKTKRYLTLSALTIALGLAATLAAPSARAQAPTIITSAPYTITKPGAYQLGADLVYNGNGAANDAIITIAVGNVTLDFNGHYISGPNNAPDTSLYGIYANERGNLIIKDGTIAYCNMGINLAGNGGANSLNINQQVNNMLISYCYFVGVYLNGASNSAVSDCRISLIGGTNGSSNAYGIYSTGTGLKLTNNTITNVTAKSGGGSFGILTSPTSFVTANTISNCQNGVFGGKYQFNLTSGCTTAFSGGTDALYNN